MFRSLFSGNFVLSIIAISAITCFCLFACQSDPVTDANQAASEAKAILSNKAKALDANGKETSAKAQATSRMLDQKPIPVEPAKANLATIDTNGQQVVVIASQLSEATAKISTMQEDVRTLAADVDAANARADNEARLKIISWAAMLVLISVGAYVLGGWNVFSGNISAAITLCSFGAMLDGLAASMIWFANHINLVAGISLLLFVGLIAYVIYAHISWANVTSTLGVIVGCIENSINGPAIKADISAASGDLSGIVKTTVTGIKNELGIGAGSVSVVQASPVAQSPPAPATAQPTPTVQLVGSPSLI